ncbi:hypothetical protein GCM10010129_01550 [Streptomyces fumigatiscleroticus]|nr:hypothetical protein GCM10010129_01550 [Streptomyces fumigatiscleroticus]
MDAKYQRHDATSAEGIANELIDVYARVYDSPPYVSDPFFSVSSFTDRLKDAITTEGFETVTARRDGRIIGYVHGVTLPADRMWWTSLAEQRPARLRTLADAGLVFWLRELMVLPEVQNRGVGKRLHDTMIAGRAERITLLTCVVDNQPAHDAYLRWGYTIIGSVKHAPESPVYDAMYLPSPC